MFRKKCNKCGKTISSGYKFCPHCSNPIKSKSAKKDYGMLGENDFMNFAEDNSKGSMFDRITENFMGKMIGSAMKMVEREFQKEMNNVNTMPKTNFRLMINGKEIPVNQMPVKQQPQKKPTVKKIDLPELTKEQLKKIKDLQKKEPVTKLRRLSDRVIYEIKMPGVQSLKDLSILQLENSIEIKALAKNKSYIKRISVNLPIVNYNLQKGILNLELEAKD